MVFAEGAEEAVTRTVTSIVMIGSCLFFMFNNLKKVRNTIQHMGVGYILIQLSSLFIRVLEQVGKNSYGLFSYHCRETGQGKLIDL